MRESGIIGIQLHGFQLPTEVTAIKRRLGDHVTLLKVLHIQNDKRLERPLLKHYAITRGCGADPLILDNLISRERSGGTGQRIPTETVESLVEVFVRGRVFPAGGLDNDGVRELHSTMPLRGVNIDDARTKSRIDAKLVTNIVSAARVRLN